MKNTRSAVLPALGDPRLACVSLSGRGTYVELLLIADALKSPVIRFGNHTPTLSEIARALGAEVAEIKRNLDDLVTFGLVQRGQDDAITVCALSRQFERCEINRANGARGGRPRSNPQRTAKKPNHG